MRFFGLQSWREGLKLWVLGGSLQEWCVRSGRTELLSRQFAANMLSNSAFASPTGTDERRKMRRFDMRLPAIVHLDRTLEFHTETQNVSARGVFFYLDRAMAEGTELELTLTFPPHITLTDSVRVRFKARVIRVEAPSPSQRVGTAASIEDYEFLKSAGTAEMLEELERGN